MVIERVPFIRGKADAKPSDGGIVKAAGLQIFSCVCSLGRAKLGVEEAGGGFVHRVKPILLDGRSMRIVLSARLLFHGDARHLGKLLHRVAVLQAFGLHHKGDHVSPCAATEAIIAFRSGKHSKGRRFLAMEGTASHHVRTRPSQGHEPGDHVGDTISSFDLFQKGFRKSHYL